MLLGKQVEKALKSKTVREVFQPLLLRDVRLVRLVLNNAEIGFEIQL